MFRLQVTLLARTFYSWRESIRISIVSASAKIAIVRSAGLPEQKRGPGYDVNPLKRAVSPPRASVSPRRQTAADANKVCSGIVLLDFA